MRICSYIAVPVCLSRSCTGSWCAVSTVPATNHDEVHLVISVDSEEKQVRMVGRDACSPLRTAYRLPVNCRDNVTFHEPAACRGTIRFDGYHSGALDLAVGGRPGRHFGQQDGFEKSSTMVGGRSAYFQRYLRITIDLSPVPKRGDMDFRLRREVADRAAQFTGISHVLTIDGENYVARRKACRIRTGTGKHLADDGALRHVGTERRRKICSQILYDDTELSASDLSMCDQFRKDVLYSVRWNSKSDPYAAARRVDDSAVYANHTSVEVDQGASGITWVDGGVRLDVAFIGSVSKPVLPSALTMPCVAVWERPNGFPTATT